MLAVHESVVNNNDPDIVLLGAPVYVTTPPLVVASLKIGCVIEILAFCNKVHVLVAEPTHICISFELILVAAVPIAIIYKVSY